MKLEHWIYEAGGRLYELAGGTNLRVVVYLGDQEYREVRQGDLRHHYDYYDSQTEFFNKGDESIFGFKLIRVSQKTYRSVSLECEVPVELSQAMKVIQDDSYRQALEASALELSNSPF